MAYTEWERVGSGCWEEFNRYSGPPSVMTGSGYLTPNLAVYEYGGNGSGLAIKNRFGEAWHGFTELGGTTSPYNVVCKFNIGLIYDGTDNSAEFRARIHQLSNGSSLWAGVEFVDIGAATEYLYIRFYEEYNYEFTELSSGTEDGSAWGSNGLSGSYFQVTYTGNGSWQARYRENSTKYYEYEYVTSDYAPGGEGIWGFKYNLLPAIMGTADADTIMFISFTPHYAHEAHLTKYDANPASAGGEMSFIGTARASLYGEAPAEYTGWIKIHKIPLSTPTKALSFGDFTQFGFRPVENGGFSSETFVELQEETYFRLFGTLGARDTQGGTFVYTSTIPSKKYDEYQRMFCGKPIYENITYDYLNKRVKVPLQSLLPELVNVTFKPDDNNENLPYITLGSIWSISNGTYVFRRSGNQLGQNIVQRALCHGTMSREGASTRIGSLIKRTYYSSNNYTDSYITFTDWTSWQQIGHWAYMTTPWPSPSLLSEYNTQPDYFVKQLLDYMGIPYSTTDINWVYWKKSVQNLGVHGIPRYYGGEKCLDILNDIMTSLNTTYSLSPDGYFIPCSQFISVNSGTEVDLSEGYQEDFSIKFTKPYAMVNYQYGWVPEDAKYTGSFGMLLGTLGQGGEIEISSPWAGKSAMSAAVAARSVRSDTFSRPVIHLTVEGSRWNDFLVGDLVTINSMGSILGEYWAGTSGSSLLDFVSGRVMYKTWLTNKAQADIYLVREPFDTWVYWGSSITENGSRWWY